MLNYIALGLICSVIGFVFGRCSKSANEEE